ncbi:MAG TPA: bifunctional UDP-sugar hydrolase/5'-nucleotidase, partial [Saprospiraceae bacterium]|nr:bifunctional UDP-sugar hydrolase/5'-nucleotidase [Saprospiraceae bacterium]
WISDTRLVGGMANITTMVKNEKKKNKHTLYLDAGDYFTGPYMSTLTKGAAIIDIMNSMQIDATTIGNHEFDHGWKNMLTQLKKAKFPILNGNIFYKGTEKLLWNNPYMILERIGIRIGIIGLHGKFAFYDTIADEMIQGVEAKDEELYLKKYVAELRDKTDIIILLAHQGIPGRQSSTGSEDVARNLQKDIDLASKIEGLDIIITGHAHQGTPEPIIANGVIIVSTNAYSKELGKLTFSYDKNKDKITKYTNSLDIVYDDVYIDDPKTLKKINKWKKRVSKISNQVLCKIPIPLTRSYGEESYLGNMVCDAMLSGQPDLDFVISNSGALRQDIDAGAVTIGDLISAFPFSNSLEIIEMKGSDIKTLFEHGAGLTNGILQVSKGVAMKYDESKPLKSRVTMLNIKGVPLDDDKIYKFGTSNFLADGGDGFVFKNAISKKNTGIQIIQLMVDYMKSFEVYTPIMEGRVVNINK